MKTLLFATIISIMLQGSSLHDFKFTAIDGSTIDMSAYKGKKILIVNTASECGYTPQYEELQKLYEKYNGKLVVIGFPANNFGGQEPGENPEIAAFCKKNYGVTFPLSAKVSVKGDDTHPIFKYLTEEAIKLGAQDPVVKWNFTKFLVDENGKLLKVFPSKVKPLGEEIAGYLN